MTTTEQQQNAVGALLVDSAIPSVSKSKETSPAAPSIKSGESTTLEATTANHSPMPAEEANSTTSVLPLVAINNKKNSLEKIPLSSPTSTIMTTTRTAVEPPKKSRRRNYKRLLLGISFLIILFFLIALIVALIVLLYMEKSAVCLTPVCVHTAAIILNSMNATVDPCDDFFEYACGNWIKQHPIPDDAPSVSNFENLGQDLELALKDLLESGPDTLINMEETNEEAVKKAKYFYQMCLNESEIMTSWRNVFDQVLHTFGGWPSLESSSQPNIRIRIERLYGIMVSKFRADSLFKATVQPDDKNSDKHILLIDQPALNLFARDFYMLTETEVERLAYRTLIRDVLVLLGADHRIAERDSLENINEQKGKNPIQFEHDEPIVIYGAEFVARLDKLLPTFEPRVVQNYLTWCWFFKAMLRDLPDPFALTIWHGCVTRVNSLMPMATSSIYVKHHFDNEAKAQVEEMIALIMEAFVELLDEEEWLTGETKAYAKQKIKTMHQKIGYPDYLENNTAVNKEYERFFPAGILQPVFYSKHFPRSMNFGGIGVVIGHEITHGFDDRGRLYDQFGNIRQWWSYSNYVLDQISMKINGRSTKGENIADNGGLKQAYRAYKKYERYRSLPQQLPGVNLTHDQLFFLNYAQIWCGIMNDKEAVRKLRTSEHSPGPIRVKGPLSNSVDFAAAYNCPEGSPMNPIQKCKVW
uniref:Endothelin-converting enzyme 1 n=5 Tax=Meloidogyne TaxID=189290 RepID=A0A915P4C6_9BILA